MQTRIILLVTFLYLSELTTFAQEQPIEEKTKTILFHPAALTWNEYKVSIEVNPTPKIGYEYSANIQLPTRSNYYTEDGFFAPLRQSLSYLNPLRTSVGLSYGVKQYGSKHNKSYWGYETNLRYLWFHNKYMAYIGESSKKDWVGKYTVDQATIGEMIQIGSAPTLIVNPNQKIVFDFYVGVGFNINYSRIKEWGYVEGSSSYQTLNIGSSPQSTKNVFNLSPAFKFGVKIGLQWEK